jgi:hypothetical protein
MVINEPVSRMPDAAGQTLDKVKIKPLNRLYWRGQR